MRASSLWRQLRLSRLRDDGNVSLSWPCFAAFSLLQQFRKPCDFFRSFLPTLQPADSLDKHWPHCVGFGIAMPRLQVCATPDAGFWTVDGDVERLISLIEENDGNYSVPCEKIGTSPRQQWDDDESNNFPVVGFAAELLQDIVSNMGPDWSCDVSVLPTYTAALYATTKMQVCDVAYSPFGVTAARAYCAEFPPETTSTPACPAYNPATTWANASASDACCAAFNYNMIVSSVAGVVLQSTNVLDIEEGMDWDLIAEAINMLSYYLAAVIIGAHLVWLLEKTDPSRNTFRRDYLNGSFDAIWAASNGFAGVGTTCARMVAMLFSYGSLAFFAVLTGLLASMLTSARLENTLYRWTLLQDISRETVVCCPAPAYKSSFDVLRLAQTYSPDDNSLDSCMADLFSGVCDVVAYDEPVLQAQMIRNTSWTNLYQILPGTDELVLSSAFSGERSGDLKGTFEQAVIEAQDQARVYGELYFGSGGMCKTYPWFVNCEHAPSCFFICLQCILLTASQTQSSPVPKIPQRRTQPKIWTRMHGCCLTGIRSERLAHTWC